MAYLRAKAQLRESQCHSCCSLLSADPGSPVDYSEDSTDPDTALTNGAINPSIFPLNKTLGCTPVYPNNYILVNTIFG